MYAYAGTEHIARLLAAENQRNVRQSRVPLARHHTLLAFSRAHRAERISPDRPRVLVHRLRIEVQMLAVPADHRDLDGIDQTCLPSTVGPDESGPARTDLECLVIPQ